MSTPPLDLAIVGAGLTGLAAARRAAELGIAAEVFEASDGVGGRVRSDHIDGYICDRGFQLINTSYPALSRYYRPVTAGPHRFHSLDRAIDVVINGRVQRLGDPREGLSSLLGGISTVTGTWSEKLRFLRYLRAISQGRFNESRDDLESDSSFEDEMYRIGVGTFYARVIAPFASGVFLNLPSRISARVARELIHYFVIGNPGLSYGGVGALSRSLASGVNVHLDSSVDEIGEDNLRIGRKRIRARAVIVATDPLNALALIGDSQTFNWSSRSSRSSKEKFRFNSTMSSSTTWYHSVDGGDFPSLLRIDGGGSGPVTNSIAISKVAPEYAPDGKTLISSTVMGAFGQEVSEARVRAHLAQMWQMETSSWELIAKYAIERSLPLLPPGSKRQVSLALPTKKGSMLRYIAGDFLALPAQQGAMESGIDAAEEVAARL